MTTTAQNLIDRARAGLQSGQRDNLNLLATGIFTTTTTLSFKYPPDGMAQGSRISVGTETMIVASVDYSAQTADVYRAMEGTAAQQHGTDLVRVNPKFTDAELLQALNDDIADLSSPLNGLYRVKSVELTYNANLVGYDLTGATDIQDIYEIKYQTPGPYKAWPRMRFVDWRLERSADTSDEPSGMSLHLFAPAYQGYKVRVVYKAAFGQIANTSDDVASVTGLPVTALDLPILGAQLRLMSPREVGRNFTTAQGEARRAEEVPAGAVLNSYRGIMALRQERIAAEAARLLVQYPPYMEA